MSTNFRNRIAMLGAVLMLGGAFGCANTGDRSAGAVMDDTAITTKVKSAFASDPDVSALRVSVKTVNGRVNLTGEVKSNTEKRKAEQVARGVSGVTSVNNELTVAN
jgi:hyperosmotically inducible periplasmic protein